MCDVRFYQEISQRKLDQVREEIRELVQYLDRSTREIVYTDFEDSEVTIEEGGGLSHSQDLIPYKSKAA